MDSPTRSPGPSLPPTAPHDIPAAARRTAKLVGRVGWLGFWLQLVAGTVIVALLVIAVISRTFDDGERSFWVGLSIFLAIASFVVLLLGIWLAFRLTRCAKRLILPYMSPTPDPDSVYKRVVLTLTISMVGLGIGLFGTEISTLSLLAKTFAHPQGAALYAPESTLRVLDVIVILIDSGLAITHFCGLAIYAWLLQRIQTIQ